MYTSVIFLDGDAGPLDGGFYSDGAEVRSGHGGERTVELKQVYYRQITPISKFVNDRKKKKKHLTLAVGVRAALRIYASWISLLRETEELNCRCRRPSLCEGDDTEPRGANLAVALNVGCILARCSLKSNTRGDE